MPIPKRSHVHMYTTNLNENDLRRDLMRTYDNMTNREPHIEREAMGIERLSKILCCAGDKLEILSVLLFTGNKWFALIVFGEGLVFGEGVHFLPHKIQFIPKNTIKKKERSLCCEHFEY